MEGTININEIKRDASLFDEGYDTEATRMAKLLETAYKAGIKQGIADAEQAFRRTHILMYGCAGNA